MSASGLGEYTLFLDRHWRAQRMEMRNHRTGKSTVLIWSDYRLNTGLGDRDFHGGALPRLRQAPRTPRSRERLS